MMKLIMLMLIISILLFIVLPIVIFLHCNNFCISMASIIGLYLIGIVILITCANLYTHSDIKELTVYQNRDIEIVGKNGFGDVRNEKYIFSEYDVKESNTNVFVPNVKHCEIKLAPKYYEQYRKNIEKEKTIHIKID